MRLRSPLAAVALVLFTVFSVVTTTALPASAVATTSVTASQPELVSAAVETDPYSVEITGLSAEVIAQDEDLTLTGTITNNTDEPLSGYLAVRVQTSTSVSSQTLLSWLLEDGFVSTVQVHAEKLEEEIAPGETVSFSTTVSADSLPFSNTSQWGPRGVSVRLTDGSSLLTQDRSIVIWSEDTAVDPTRVTAVVPVTASAEELTVLHADQPDEQAIETIRQRVLDLLGLAGQGVVLAIDPSLLEELSAQYERLDFPQMTPEGTEAATDTESDTTDDVEATTAPEEDSTDTDGDSELQSAVSAALETGNVIVLPWEDADVSALVQLGQDELLTQAYQLSEDSTLLETGHYNVAWTAGDTIDSQTLAALPESVSSVLVSPGNMDVLSNLTYTPSGVAADGSYTYFIADELLSNAFAGKAQSDDDSQVALNDLDAVQLLRAGTATMTRQLPNQGRSAIVMLDRETAANTSAQVLAARIAALNTSWTSLSDLSALLSEDPSGASRTALESDPDTDESVSADELLQAAEIVDELSILESVLTNPEAALGDYESLPLVTANSAWRGEADLRADFLDQVSGRKSEVMASLTTAPSSTINLVNSQANIPVTVLNALDQDVNVIVHLESASTRLQADEDVEVTVPANSETTVALPVSAIGSGDVELEVELLAPDGTVVGTSSAMHMRVHADWENIGTGIVGILLALLMAFGIFRTVRRGRRSASIEDV